MDWNHLVGIHTAEFGHLLLIVRKCDAGHWTWYVIDDEDQELDASGSDEDEETAIANCEIAAYRQDERDAG